MNRVTKKVALSGLILGSGMAVVAAQAEPLTLTANQMDTVTASGFGFADFDAFVDVFKNFETNIEFLKFAEVAVFVDVSGFLADANAVANCIAFGCTAETFTGTDVNIAAEGGFTTTAASHSVSAGTLPPLE